MVKQLLPALGFLIVLSSCSTFKPLNFTSNKQMSVAPAASQTRFIEDISITPATVTDKTEVRTEPAETVTVTTRSVNIAETPAPQTPTDEVAEILARRNRQIAAEKIESATSTQLKYAILMNTEVENLPSSTLLNAVDEWYGVRYRTGGNTKGGVDCSGFTVAIYAAVYGLALPRVSRDQYRISRKISTTELQEGDLVFFNTNGSGVSHVGVYLGNNKFIHASVSRGVMVNGLFEPYYSKRFIGAGRIDDKQMLVSE